MKPPRKKLSPAQRLLNLVRFDLLRRQQLEARRAELHSRLYPGSLRLKQDLIQESAPDDKISTIEAEVDELDRTITDALAGIRRRRVRVEMLISCIDNVVYRQILEMYYCTVLPTYEEAGEKRKPLRGVALLSLADVAVRLDRSYGHVRNLHQEAVTAFEEVFKSEG